MDDVEKKDRTAGIVYLSRIPTRMNVKNIRHIFSSFGDVGRIFLQPKGKMTDMRKNRIFTEGWVEFSDKRIARKVAATLNNTLVGGKRRSPWYHDLWNIKYLPRFTWNLLNERLAYERAVHKSRLRSEVSVVKRETEHFVQCVKQSKSAKKREKQKTVASASTVPDSSAVQRTVEQTVMKDAERPRQTSSTAGNNNRTGRLDSDFYKQMFSGGFQ